MSTTPTDLLTVELDTETLTLYYQNPRQGDIAAIAESLATNGQYRAIVVNKGTHTGRPMEVLAGNHTLKAARKLGWNTIACHIIDVDDEQATRIVLADNRTSDLATTDEKTIIDLLDTLDTLDGTGYTDTDLETLLDTYEDTPDTADDTPPTTLADRFGIPPLTIIDTRQGVWQERKRAWRALTGYTTDGREDRALYKNAVNLYTNWYQVKNAVAARIGRTPTEQEVINSPESVDLRPYASGTGTSEYDAALAEILTLWHTATGDHIIDPWAGGLVRGVVAATLGRHYTGIDISMTQCEANREAWETRAHQAEGRCEWITADSLHHLPTLPANTYDFMLACPPYYDLEIYSTTPGDMSTMTHTDFDHAMTQIIAEIARVLKNDRFAAITVGNVRDKKGRLIPMTRTIYNAADSAGLTIHQDYVIVKAVGTAAIRAARSFNGTRTVPRVHEHVIIMCKGSPKKATERLSETDITNSLHLLTSSDAAEEE